MASKKKIAGKAGAKAAKKRAETARPYVQRLIEDDELRDNLRTAFESARKAYGRINGKGPVKALTEDKKVQKELREAASSLRAESGSVSTRTRGPPETLGIPATSWTAEPRPSSALVISEGTTQTLLAEPSAIFGIIWRYW